VIWNNPLNQHTYKFYAMRYYSNSRGSWEDFFSDLKQLTYVSKGFMSRKETSSSKQFGSIRLIVNNIIYLGNLFPGESLARLLFFSCNPAGHSELKTVLKFLYRLPDDIPEVELGDIPFCPDTEKELREL
jgi:hypothetical protein